MTTIVDAPARADGLQLLGTMVGSGYRTPPALVRRGDGQTLQLTPLLYLVLDAVDGRRSCAEIADIVEQRTGREMAADLVATVVSDHLRPMGVLKLADGTDPALRRSDPLLGLKLRFSVTDPQATRRITDPFRVLFHPVVMTVITAGFLAVVGWVFFRHGLGPAAYDAFQRPHLLLLVFVVTVLSGGFHEFGHAAAARYGGAEPGAMGAGIYLVWPAFYTDVTDSYRLDRGGRVRTDLGGLHFNAVVVCLTFAWWAATGWDALLLLVATQVMQMVQQLMPMLRFDGYHLLADLTGVPDLYTRIKPTLLGLLPHHWRDPENRVLKPWARVVITAWVLVTVPLMAFMLFTLVTSLPRVLGSAWQALRRDAGRVPEAWSAGGPVDGLAQVVQVLAVLLPVLAGLLILGRLSRRWVLGLVAWSRGSAMKRVTALVVASVAVTGLSWAWWPNPETYEPIQPGEKGLLTAALPGANAAPALPSAAQAAAPARGGMLPGASAERRLSSDTPLQATFQEGKRLPSREKPQLALVLVPSEDGGGTSTGDVEEPWVFPFDKPLPPGEGDNQAAAYNTTDDSVRYDLAFAMVWATGDEVLNVNEARAYASCSNCVTVAVAFQVVLIVDDAHVVVPQNIAVAANYDCYRCITAAVANQLVLSLDGEPGEEQLRALGEVWGRLTAFGRNITSYSLTEITTRLEQFKAEITQILGKAPPTSAASTAPSPSSSPGASGSAQPSSPPADTASGAPSSSPAPQDSTSAPPAEPSPSADPSPTQGETEAAVPEAPASSVAPAESDTATTSP